MHYTGLPYAFGQWRPNLHEQEAKLEPLVANYLVESHYCIRTIIIAWITKNKFKKESIFKKKKNEPRLRSL